MAVAAFAASLPFLAAEVASGHSPGGGGHGSDGGEDGSAGCEGDQRRHGRRDQEHQEHPSARRFGHLPGPVVLVAHVLLVDFEDVVGALVDGVEQGEHVLEIEGGSDLLALGRKAEEPGRLPLVFGVQLGEVVGHLLLAGKGHVVLFDLELFLEELSACAELGLGAVLLAADGEPESRVHPFEPFLHSLGGDDAPVVLDQDDVDVVAQPGEQGDRPEA